MQCIFIFFFAFALLAPSYNKTTAMQQQWQCLLGAVWWWWWCGWVGASCRVGGVSWVMEAEREGERRWCPAALHRQPHKEHPTTTFQPVFCKTGYNQSRVMRTGRENTLQIGQIGSILHTYHPQKSVQTLQLCRHVNKRRQAALQDTGKNWLLAQLAPRVFSFEARHGPLRVRSSPSQKRALDPSQRLEGKKCSGH
jgi:hypothetical protein